MKTLRFVLLALLFVTLASPAMAGKIQVGYSGSSYGLHQTGQGGEFTYNDLNLDGTDNWLDLSAYASTTKNLGPAGVSSFQTFCIEHTEAIGGYPSTYYATINTDAVFGGTGTSDPISRGTGYLYSQFAKGTLSGYNYGVGRSVTSGSSDALLQQTIWWLEGEAGDPGVGNVFRNNLIAAFGDAATAKLDGGSSMYGVYAVNLWSSATVHTAGTAIQDGLYLYERKVPDGGATATLLGLGLLGFGLLFRRKNSR